MESRYCPARDLWAPIWVIQNVMEDCHKVRSDDYGWMHCPSWCDCVGHEGEGGDA